MYMTASHTYAVRRDYRHYVDISKFTGMEVEHKHDTTSRYAHINSLEVNAENIRNHNKNVAKELGQIRSQAL